MSGKAADAYSFGVLLWQMLTGARPWSGLRHDQVVAAVVAKKQVRGGSHGAAAGSVRRWRWGSLPQCNSAVELGAVGNPPLVCCSRATPPTTSVRPLLQMLAFPGSVPKDVAALARACLSWRASERPDMGAVHAQLAELLRCGVASEDVFDGDW
jgi:hypothetical protein